MQWRAAAGGSGSNSSSSGGAGWVLMRCSIILPTQNLESALPALPSLSILCHFLLLPVPSYSFPSLPFSFSLLFILFPNYSFFLCFSFVLAPIGIFPVLFTSPFRISYFPFISYLLILFYHFPFFLFFNVSLCSLSFLSLTSFLFYISSLPSASAHFLHFP